MAKTYRYLDFVTAAFVAVLLVSNIAATKTVILGAFTFDGGTLLFPLAYIFGDILTEVYGYKRSRRVIWIGFLWIGVAALTFAIVDALPPEPSWNQLPEGVANWTRQDSFSAILGQAPRIVLASLLAYLAGEFANSFILAKLKVATEGRWLWVRTISSTLVGQGVDTAIFVVVAFAGVLPGEVIGAVLASNYVFKVGVEALFTPITVRAVNFLKQAEGEDYFDRETDFNPFAVRL
jgi:hypothetical protein